LALQTEEKVKLPIAGNAELGTVLLHCHFHYLTVDSHLNDRVLRECFELARSVPKHVRHIVVVAEFACQVCVVPNCGASMVEQLKEFTFHHPNENRTSFFQLTNANLNFDLLEVFDDVHRDCTQCFRHHIEVRLGI
jgi:hypothetical protein